MSPSTSPTATTNSADTLVLGGSGAVGRYLLRRISVGGRVATVLSRRPAPAWSRPWSGLHWLPGALPGLALSMLSDTSVLISAGPLDCLADVCAAGLPPGLQRVVALSSLSIEWKRNSPNPAERALAARLLAAECTLTDVLGAAQVPLLLLRPSMIYGAGIDLSLTPLLRYAQRWGLLPWPQHGRGLRCPVHADDVAAALYAGAFSGSPLSATIDLPGPRGLPFDQLLDTLLQSLANGARRVPIPLPQAVLRQMAGGRSRLAAGAATVLRSGSDQQASAVGWHCLGITPRAFLPQRDDFVRWPE